MKLSIDHLCEYTYTEALRYYERDWKVAPVYIPTEKGCSCGKQDCTSTGKHPALRKWKQDDGEYTQEVLLQDVNFLRKWFDAGEHNVGIFTGKISGLVVLDIDSQEGEQYASRIADPFCILISIIRYCLRIFLSPRHDG